MMSKLAPQFGLDVVETSFAQRGDILLINPKSCGSDPRFGGALGICADHWAAVMTEKGLRMIRLRDHAIRAWRVP